MLLVRMSELCEGVCSDSVCVHCLKAPEIPYQKLQNKVVSPFLVRDMLNNRAVLFALLRQASLHSFRIWAGCPYH